MKELIELSLFLFLLVIGMIALQNPFNNLQKEENEWKQSSLQVDSFQNQMVKKQVMANKNPNCHYNSSTKTFCFTDTEK